MRHFYVRAKVYKTNNHPWKDKVTYDESGYARIPIGCVAMEYNNDIIIGAPNLVFNMAVSFASPEDNFNYHVANKIACGRLKAHKGKCIDGDLFKKTVENQTAHKIFNEMNLQHKHLAYIDPELFAISARACMKKLALDKADAEKLKHSNED